MFPAKNWWCICTPSDAYELIFFMNLPFISDGYTNCNCSQNGWMHICILLLMQYIYFFLVYTSSERNCSTLFQKMQYIILKQMAVYTLWVFCWYILLQKKWQYILLQKKWQYIRLQKNGSTYSLNFVVIYSFKKFSIHYLKGSIDLFTKKKQYMSSMCIGYISSTTHLKYIKT